MLGVDGLEVVEAAGCGRALVVRDAVDERDDADRRVAPPSGLDASGSPCL
jgi:hypothetical protein